MAEIPQFRLGELESKLLTLHALHELGPCTNLQLIAFMSQSDAMNYFDLQSALYDLAQRGQVIKEPLRGDDLYTITPMGEEAIALFLGRLGESVLFRVDEAVPAFREQMRRQKELFSSISHEGRNEYHAKMGITEGSMPLMQLDLSLPTAELAKRFSDSWQSKAREIYDFIIKALSGEDLQ